MLGKLFGRYYQPLNLIEVSEKNLIHNFNYLSDINKNIRIAPVLKSNAYGHGLALTAKILDQHDPPFLCVDSLYEAYELTKNGIKTPILIMGFVDPVSLKTKSLPYSFAVFNNEQIDALAKYQPNAKIHIFVDTGMHREGIPIEDLAGYVTKITDNTELQIEGIMSHFGESEVLDNPITQKQIEEFRKITDSINSRWTHISNSGGVLNKIGIGNMGRVGIALYGISPLGKDPNLKPALTLKTHIAQIKELKKGESVGYSFTFKADEAMKIAVLPIGYYDGVDRRLSNKGFVTIKETACRIIGKVSMNITTIDVSAIKNPAVGDEVIVFSDDLDAINSIENSAKICETIPYELLVNLASSTKRVSK